MSFSKDLFISYAHIDNQPLTAEEEGWVTRFHASLEAMLEMRKGGEAQIWRDNKLAGNDVFADEIVDQFADTAALVSVLTPRYLNSEWCTKEVAEFCTRAERTGGMVVGNKARVFKVIKTPVDTQEKLPKVMQDLLGYEFFTYEDEAPLELDPAYGKEYAQDYNRKVGILAFQISETLKRLEAEIPAGAGVEQDAARPPVYLAECGYDQKEAREALEAELELHGYSVLPDQELPRDETAYLAEVDRLLERCALSVHLVGASPGAVPDGPSQRSVVTLQNDLAAGRSESGALRRVIWLPEGSASEQPAHQAFLEALHNDPKAQLGADLVTADFEKLKASVHAALAKLEATEPEPEAEAELAAEADGPRSVYLICTEKDRKATVPLRKFLKGRGLEVSLPAFQGKAAEVRAANESLLSSCDAVLVFYGEGDEPWKRTIDSELKRAPGYRNGRPLLASRTYLAAPGTSDKEDLVDMEADGLIDGLEGFSEAAVAELVAALESSGGAS